jgi:hypothetical protein
MITQDLNDFPNWVIHIHKPTADRSILNQCRDLIHNHLDDSAGDKLKRHTAKRKGPWKRKLGSKITAMIGPSFKDGPRTSREGDTAPWQFGPSWKYHKYRALFRMFHFYWIIIYFFNS